MEIVESIGAFLLNLIVEVWAAVAERPLLTLIVCFAIIAIVYAVETHQRKSETEEDE